LGKRTTVKFDEDVLAAVRERASKDSRTISDIVNETLRAGLLQQSSLESYRLRLKPFEFGGKWVDVRDRRALQETLSDRDRRKFSR
jgi:hypothetical protein